MKHYGFLVLPDFSNLCLANSVEPLRAANDLAAAPAYQVTLTSMDGRAVRSYSGFMAPVTARLDELLKRNPPDILFVLASYNYQAHAGVEVTNSLRRAASVVPILGGLDAGTFILAKAGLLRGYRASIHWTAQQDFSENFPHINVLADRYVIDRDRITSGGSSSALDLMINLIRTDCGEAVATAVSELLIFDTERPGYTRQMAHAPSGLEQKSPRISRAIEIMNKHIEMPLSVLDIANLTGISQRQLERDFKAVMNQTVAKYYLSLRLMAARRLIRETRLSITEVAIRCGFGSHASFIRAYKQYYDRTPSHDRKLGYRAPE